MLPAVRELQERINRATAGLGDQTLAAVLPVLADMRRELAHDMAAWLKRHPQDGAERWTYAKYASLLSQVRGALEAAHAIAPAMFAGLKTTGRTAGEMALRHLEQQIAVASKAFGQPILLDLDTVAIMAEGRSLLIPQFKASAEKYSSEAEALIRHQLAVGIGKGESWEQMAKRVARLGAGPGDPHEPTPGGMARGLWRMSMHSAYRIARTEGMNALNAHGQLGLEHWAAEEPGAMKIWDASQDMACLRCRALNNEALPVRGMFYDAARGYFLHPTLHPHCRCCIRPHHKDWS